MKTKKLSAVACWYVINSTKVLKLTGLSKYVKLTQMIKMIKR